jgi:hypothetical protein
VLVFLWKHYLGRHKRDKRDDFNADKRGHTKEMYSELLGFWTFSIVRCSQVAVGDTYFAGSLRKS